METYSVREQIIETVNRLFIYTDNRDWDRLESDVFAARVDFDMRSVGGVHSTLAGKAICDLWAKGFEGIDAVNHLAGNYLVDIDDSAATVFCYATATHFKDAAVNGKTREFVGSYDIVLSREQNRWKISGFAYALKYAHGNLDLS